MLEFLALLAVATVIVLGWVGGSRFVCVFLTLPVVVIGLAAGSTSDGPVGPAILLALLVIWIPYIYHRIPGR